MVDSHAVIHQAYFYHHQAIIYVYLYNSLKDILFQKDNNVKIVEKHIVLLSSYTVEDWTIA